MIKLKAAIYVFTKSLTSPKYYNDIVKTNFGFSMKYFSVLALISSLVAFSGLVKPIMTDLGDSLKAVETTVVDSFPDDLEITVKDGEVSINQPEPYIFQTPEEGFESTMEEGQEVPFRHDMRRRGQGLCRQIILRLAEEIRREEHEKREDRHEDREARAVLHCVIGMEGHRVLRPLRIDTQRVVRPRHMQRNHMQDNHPEDQEREQIMQREEAVQGRVIDREATPEQGDD